MRVVIQRVKQASVTINQEIHTAIGPGLLILLGIEDSDTQEDLQYLAAKTARLRVFDDPTGIMNLSVTDIRGELLVVSQFTLHASTKKGNRPSYIRASKPEVATPLYEAFKQALQQESGLSVMSGVFGAMMDVALINDGPVTIIMDSKNKE